MTTIHTLAAEYNLTPAEAWARMEGFAGNVDGSTPLTAGGESLARELLAPRGFTDCGCAPAVGHTSPCLLAPAATVAAR